MLREYLIVGLGNPGPRYANTRHNVGFAVVDELASRWKITCWESAYQAMLVSTTYAQSRVWLVKPLTYMNNSGQAVSAIVKQRQIPLDHLCVVYDDVHLELATLRIRRKGSDGGHNGVKSLIHHLDSQDFARIRMGIGSSVDNRIDHVLSAFQENERERIEVGIQIAADGVATFIRHGVDVAMNRFNRKTQNDSPAEQPAESATPATGSSDLAEEASLRK